MNNILLYEEIIKIIPYFDAYLKQHDIKEQYIIGLKHRIKTGAWSATIESISKYPQSIFTYSFSWIDANEIIRAHGLNSVKWNYYYSHFKKNYNVLMKSLSVLKSFKYIKII
jgi:hypothetical protein